MMEKGFNAEVLTVLNPERGEMQHEYHNKLQVHRFVRDSSRFSYYSFDVRLFSYMMKRNYSLVHLHSVDWYVDKVPWLVSKIKKTPMVFTSHSPGLMEALLNLESMPFRRKMLLKNAEMLRDSSTCTFIAFTQCQAESYRKIGVKNIRLIPHGIDPKAFRVKRDNTIIDKYGLDEYNLLCVGTMETRKGQLFLVKSMPRILKEFPNTKLFLVGRTYASDQAGYASRAHYLRTLKSLVNEMRLKEKVIFLDDVPRSDLIQLYLLSSLFVFPTEAEMAPLVFLEAMAAGLPVISTNKPYLREILGNGEAGILVEREQQSIESAILRLLSDNALRTRLGSNGKKIVEQKHRLDKVIQQYWDLYESLLN
jgi:glycosyltransferase involved in cell wall biosynthesis